MEKYKVLLQSENIDYVEVNESLINDYLKMINDEEIQKRVSSKRRTFTYEEELKWIKIKLENNDVIFSMIERSTNEFIGNIEFMDVTNESATIGISITPNKQDKHYGTEALKTLIDYGFNKMNLSEINLIVFSNNTRAIHCYKKLGFVEYKVDKNVTVIDNEQVDDIYMKLTK